ncbi:hypothetical protein SAMN04489712_12724 [Thermomonospora echinospora]|uniref:Uncharacterized protein n=1 Tax=Thermomonospora echinospora TaxID=1992 RepID=A0A1H6E046_9ACTN|nr:hypothetical protein [Thermomonospora echinospora]SEG90739.1 hypothetical protein SAMN04489712_12724 [Thermomonospora echinospora]
MGFDMGRRLPRAIRPDVTDQRHKSTGTAPPRPAPGPMDRPRQGAGSETRHRSRRPGNDLRLRCRVRLLTLAGDLDDLGVRCRLTDTISPPFTLRCWNPARQGPAIEVACGLDRYGRLVFQVHPDGEFLGDAEAALQPGDTVDLARELARRLGIDPAWRG